MKIKKGDNVKVRAGKDAGKTGKILQVFRAEGRVSVEGVNILSKHLRKAGAGKEGQKIEFPAWINVSNVSLVCPHCSKATRVGYSVSAKEGNKVEKKRVCKKCQEII